MIELNKLFKEHCRSLLSHVNMRNVGFTGSKHSMTDYQVQVVTTILEVICEKENTPSFHMGDCIGADVQAAKIAKSLGFMTISHPPTNPSKRAFYNADSEWIKKPYLTRNKDIVNISDILIAAPKEAKEVLRSGTWATIRYAKQLYKQWIIVFPLGTLRYSLEVDGNNENNRTL